TLPNPQPSTPYSATYQTRPAVPPPPHTPPRPAL
ncbi:hypothetical protein GNI_161820, partial [Gregarina niphandrodes]